jgi:hypothetical protein
MFLKTIVQLFFGNGHISIEGGVEKVFVELSNLAVEKNYKVISICNSSSIDEKPYFPLDEKVKFHNLGLGKIKVPFYKKIIREIAKWVNKVHERAVCNLPKETLCGYIRHYTYINWEQHFSKMNNYSTIAAQNYISQGKKCYFFRDIILRPLWAFIKVYFMQGGFLDGKMGWILSVSHYSYTMNKYVKLYYLYKTSGKL